MGTQAPSAPPPISAPALALAVGLPRAFAQAGAPSLAALHLGRLRLANEIPGSTTTALCCPACSAPTGLSTNVRLVRSRRAKARAKKTKAHVVNSRVLRCNVCAFEVREPGSDRTTVDAFPSARKAARTAAALAPPPPVVAPTAHQGSASFSRPSSTLASAGRPPPSPAPSSVRLSPLSSAGSSPAPSACASPALAPAAPPSKAGCPAPASIAAPPPAASSARKKKPQTTLQKMLALNKAREEADAAAKKSSGGLLDWM